MSAFTSAETQTVLGLPIELAIGVIAAPRPVATVDACLAGLRRGGFWQTIRVFAEPGAAVEPRPGVEVHQNSTRLGMWSNWLQAATRLLRETHADWLLLCEDDLTVARGAALALQNAVESLPHADWGFVSLYTPRQNVSDAALSNGWQPLNLGRRTWGSLGWCFRRETLMTLLNSPTVLYHYGDRDNDSILSQACTDERLQTWHHFPSLGAHLGGANSSVGHCGAPGMMAVDFDPEYVGYEAGESHAPMCSCILPVEARAPALVVQAVRYFLRQLYPRKELIVVTDDETQLAHFLPEDPRVRLVAAPAEADRSQKLKLGVNAACGEFWADWNEFAWYEECRLSVQMAVLRRKAANFVGLNSAARVTPGGAVQDGGGAASHGPNAAPGTLLGTRPSVARLFGEPPAGDEIETPSIEPSEDSSVFVADAERRGLYATLVHKARFPAVSDFEPREPATGIGNQLRLAVAFPLDLPLPAEDRRFYAWFQQQIEPTRNSHQEKRAVLPRGLARELPAAGARGIVSSIRRGPAVSIVVAARNCAPYLREALESTLVQTHPCEVIYADDGSLDQSVRIAREFEPRGVVVLDSDGHRGVCYARNRGAYVARGDFLVFLDGDDWLSRDFVERHLQAIGDAPFAYGPAQAFGSLQTLWQVSDWRATDIWLCNCVNTSALWRRSVFEQCGQWRETAARTLWDWDLAIRAARFGTPRPSSAVLQYRQHAASWSHRLGEGDWREGAALRTTVRRQLARLSVGVVFSGRLPDLLERWIDELSASVRRIVLSDAPELVLIDNSGDRRLAVRLAREVDRRRESFGRVRIIDLPERIPADLSAADRPHHVARHLAATYNRLVEAMTGDVHWLVEDDILVPLKAGEMLWNTLTDSASLPHAVAGCYRNRHLPELYVGGYWRGSRAEELRELPADRQPISIDFTGTGCLMYWRNRPQVPREWRSHFQGIPAHDWDWGMRLKGAGGVQLLLPAVKCGHARTVDDVV